MRGGLTVVTGDNGAGKTSLLEAIGYASTQRSLRGSPREALIRNGASSAVVRLEAVTDERATLVEIEIAPPRRDQVLRNKQRISRIQELLETIEVTVFTPDDLALVKSGPQARRDFLDEVVTSAHPRLTRARQSAERVLRQRNVLLRQSGGRANQEVTATLDVWDEQLAAAGTVLCDARDALVAELEPVARQAFSRLTGSPVGLELTYVRSFAGDLRAALAEARADDLRRGITTVGPHRDELEISSGGLDARTRLSQGRQRCVTLALRLASHDVVARHARTPPVLLLDDAFSELDDATARALVIELPPGQAILTTAGTLPPGATPDALVRLRDGKIVP